MEALFTLFGFYLGALCAQAVFGNITAMVFR
jgi:hypothetical protein